MISNDSNTSQGWDSWLKWLIGTAVTLVAAGSGIVAILEYLEPDSTYAPTDNSVTIVIVTTKDTQPDSEPTRTSIQTAQPISLPTQIPTSTVIYETPTASVPRPDEFVLSYWQNVSDGRYESAWLQLSPRFQQAAHNGNYNDYVNGYQQMNLCRTVVSNPNIVRQDSYSAIVTAHLTYYTGSQCNSSEYDFEMWLVYDAMNNSWLFDKNIMR